jgi:hypothetical protein
MLPETMTQMTSSRGMAREYLKEDWLQIQVLPFTKLDNPESYRMPPSFDFLI